MHHAILDNFGVVPLRTANLYTALAKYNSPKDKIAYMEKKNEIIRVKKGLYVSSPAIHKQLLSRELIANHLYGPSYVSLETALSFYGIIPERTETMRSVTFKRSKKFKTSLGLFEYQSIPCKAYSTGFRQEFVGEDYAYLIATPEKALCDLLLTTANLRLSSKKSMLNFLEQDLRVDLSAVKWNTGIIQECINAGKKAKDLLYLKEALDECI
jgi:predicted transcriptional regulator of viral defense system